MQTVLFQCNFDKNRKNKNYTTIFLWSNKNFRDGFF